MEYPQPMVTISFQEYNDLKAKVDESKIDDMLAVFGCIYAYYRQRTDGPQIETFLKETLPELFIDSERLAPSHKLVHRLNKQLAQSLTITRHGKGTV